MFINKCCCLKAKYAVMYVGWMVGMGNSGGGGAEGDDRDEE